MPNLTIYVPQSVYDQLRLRPDIKPGDILRAALRRKLKQVPQEKMEVK